MDSSNQTTKKIIIGRYLICRKQTARPAKQHTGELPKDKISKSSSFSMVWIEFIGPIYIKNIGVVLKSYITVFNCAVICIVHLEQIFDLSINKFILALRRILTKQNNSKIIYFDNTITFKSDSKDLK